MQGNQNVIETLNTLLADELAAINQYMVHSEMCDDWGYGRLHEAIEKRAIDEMRHAEKLIGRILFLDGRPIVSNLAEITIGADVEAQIKNDLAAELGAVKAYNDGIVLGTRRGLGFCVQIGDILMLELGHQQFDGLLGDFVLTGCEGGLPLKQLLMARLLGFDVIVNLVQVFFRLLQFGLKLEDAVLFSLLIF